MNLPQNPSQPCDPSFTAASDWNRLAGEFSAWLPLIAPYGDRLIAMADLRDGQRVLDLACGTGEPGLTVARRHPGVTVTGADASPGMVRMAESVRRGEGLANIGFAVARGERLPFADATFERVICRFGVMLFDDPAAGLAELCRVTRPGGRVALSVWSVPERVLCPALTLWTMERFGPVEWPRTFSLSAPGVLAERLNAAGFSGVEVAAFDPRFTFRDLDHFMERNLTGRFIEEPYRRMSPQEQESFRAALREAASRHRAADGRVSVVQEALLASAVRA
ncbi:MAG: methyltransferase domain-containing protein [Nitrospirota bacterium]|nr:methyltransferase domain-containing protein [Nitrospirota bacterium]